MARLCCDLSVGYSKPAKAFCLNGRRGLLAYGQSIASLKVVGKEFDPVKVERAVAHRGANPNRSLALWRNKFDFHLRAYGQVRDRKKTHSAITEVDTQAVQVRRPGKNLHGCAHPLPMGAPDWLKVSF